MAELKRSATTLLAARRGPSCPSRLNPDQELTDPQALIDEIAEYSARDEEFIRPQMTLQEMVFRVLLRRGNQPISLQELHYELTERQATPTRPINITPAGLRRILEADGYYAFAQVDGETQQS
jgi:hypothetical protein